MIECIKIIILERHWKETKNQVTLKDTQSKMEIHLTELPEDGIIIKFPSGGAHLGIASGKEGLCKSCDNLILIEHNNCIDIYFIEMKETLRLSEKWKATNQILHTIPVWDYIASMAKIHFKKSKKTNSHFTIIAKKSSNRFDKQKVKSRPSVIFTRGDKQFRIIYSASTIPFKFLKT